MDQQEHSAADPFYSGGRGGNLSRLKGSGTEPNQPETGSAAAAKEENILRRLDTPPHRRGPLEQEPIASAAVAVFFAEEFVGQSVAPLSKGRSVRQVLLDAHQWAGRGETFAREARRSCCGSVAAAQLPLAERRRLVASAKLSDGGGAAVGVPSGAVTVGNPQTVAARLGLAFANPGGG